MNNLFYPSFFSIFSQFYYSTSVTGPCYLGGIRIIAVLPLIKSRCLASWYCSVVFFCRNCRLLVLRCNGSLHLLLALQHLRNIASCTWRLWKIDDFVFCLLSVFLAVSRWNIYLLVDRQGGITLFPPKTNRFSCSRKCPVCYVQNFSKKITASSILYIYIYTHIYI